MKCGTSDKISNITLYLKFNLKEYFMVPQKEFPLLGFLLQGIECLNGPVEKDIEKRVLVLYFQFYLALALLGLFVIALICYPAYFIHPEGSEIRKQLKDCCIYPILSLLSLLLSLPMLILICSSLLYVQLILDLLVLYRFY